MQKRADFKAEYAKTWNQITHEWRARYSCYIKKLKPSCLYSVGNVSPRREFAAPFDWRSGDFYSPAFHPLHDIARMMRWYGTLDVPYDAYICDTSRNNALPDIRSCSKTLDRMLQEAATVASCGGAVGYWTYPVGHGALVPSRMKKAIAVRQFLEERKDVFLHTKSAAKAAIMVSDPSTPTFGGNNVAGAHKALAALHQSPDVMDETGMVNAASYDLIVLPEQAFLNSRTGSKLAAFVRSGGKLLTSGISIQSPELQNLLGARLKKHGAVQDGHVILKNCDEPTGIDSAWDQLELSNRKSKIENRKWVAGGARVGELYPLYLSWDQFNPEAKIYLPNNWAMHGQMDEEKPEPAGFPAAVTRKVGKGCMVHICTNIFSVYNRLGDPQILRWLGEILNHLQPEPFFKTDAPSWVDVSLRCKGDSLLIHFVNQNPGRDISRFRTDDLWVDEIPEIGPFTCKLRVPEKPRTLVWQPGNEPIVFSHKKGILYFQIPRFQIHGCVTGRVGLKTEKALYSTSKPV
jgi:hypothetical protein